MNSDYITHAFGTKSQYQDLKTSHNIDENTIYFIFAEDSSIGLIYKGDTVVGSTDIFDLIFGKTYNHTFSDNIKYIKINKGSTFEEAANATFNYIDSLFEYASDNDIDNIFSEVFN